MAALAIFDPFLRFPVGENAVLVLSIVFNAIYYLAVGSVLRLVVKKQWPVFGKVVVIAAAAGALNVSLVAVFAVCEYLLTGRLVAT